MNTIAPKLSPLSNEDFVSSYVCYMMHERAKATEDALKLCLMVYNDFQVNTWTGVATLLTLNAVYSPMIILRKNTGTRTPSYSLLLL